MWTAFPHLLQLISAHDTRHLQVALDLLQNLLETVHDWHAWDGVNPRDSKKAMKT